MAKKNLYQKLLEVKKNVDYLKKDGKGFQYEYVTPSAILARVNPILNDNGVILKEEVLKVETELLFIKPKVHTLKKGNETVYEIHPVNEVLFKVDMKMTWIDVETGEKEEVLWYGAGVNGEDKGYGSALTYGSRYFLMNQFQIPNDKEDPDAFQDKHMTDEEKRRRYLNDFQTAFDAIKTVEGLTKLKKDFPQIDTDAELKEMAKKRYEEIKPKEEPKPEEPKEEPKPKKTTKKKSEPKKEEPVLTEADSEDKEPPKEDAETQEQEKLAPETLEDYIAIGEGFQKGQKEDMVAWWKKNATVIKEKLSGDEFKQLQDSFNAHYQKIQ